MVVFSNLHKCRPEVADHVISVKPDRHGCRVKFGDSKLNRSRDIRAAHFAMNVERRRRTQVNTKIQLLAAAYYPEKEEVYVVL